MGTSRVAERRLHPIHMATFLLASSPSHSLTENLTHLVNGDGKKVSTILQVVGNAFPEEAKEDLIYK